MTDQGDLFSEHGLARNTDPPTSKVAAQTVKAARLELLVLGVFVKMRKQGKFGGLTIRELAKIEDYDLWSISPRFRPLVNKGLIYDTEVRRINPLSGKKAIVWDATERGIKAYLETKKEEI